MTDNATLSQAQRVLIAQHLERDLDPHVFRVDEKTIVLCSSGERGVEITYVLLEYGGCAGPGKTHQEKVFVSYDVYIK